VVVLRLEELCVFVANDLVQRFNLALTRIVLLSEHGVGGGDVLFILFQPPDLPEQPRSLQLFLLQRRLTPRQSVGVLHILGFQIVLALKVLGQDFPLFVPAHPLRLELLPDRRDELLFLPRNRSFALQ